MLKGTPIKLKKKEEANTGFFQVEKTDHRKTADLSEFSEKTVNFELKLISGLFKEK